eukprot:scaffold66406_cov66-Phaeocystis_antarctica.AAC.6
MVVNPNPVNMPSCVAVSARSGMMKLANEAALSRAASGSEMRLLVRGHPDHTREGHRVTSQDRPILEANAGPRSLNGKDWASRCRCRGRRLEIRIVAPQGVRSEKPRFQRRFQHRRTSFRRLQGKGVPVSSYGVALRFRKPSNVEAPVYCHPRGERRGANRCVGAHLVDYMLRS